MNCNCCFEVLLTNDPQSVAHQSPAGKGAGLGSVIGNLVIKKTARLIKNIYKDKDVSTPHKGPPPYRAPHTVLRVETKSAQDIGIKAGIFA